MRLIFLMILGYLTVKTCLPLLAQLLRKQGMVKENYRQSRSGPLGLVFPLTLPLLFLVQVGRIFELLFQVEQGRVFAFLF